ncbi:unnamed protein product [Phytophthora fragariaefolia]|uniref:Unnamed protein product n=1 Tax=Phytophthora fragariaefolia TaxID=1490495 RepID=A0A9W6XYD0_9STRA|nr:unnamed protein product [Phytophthora fragariaefolia]
MGKGVEWSEAETIQLCKSWLETSQDPVRGVSQKKCTFYSRIYEHWLEHKPADADSRESAIAARWKKMQPEVTKFSGLYSKLKSRERSGWNDTSLAFVNTQTRTNA